MSKLFNTSSNENEQTNLSNYSVKFDLLPKPTGLTTDTSSTLDQSIEHFYNQNGNDWLWSDTQMHHIQDGKENLYSTPHMSPTTMSCSELAEYLHQHDLTVRVSVNRNGRDSEKSIVQLTAADLQQLGDDEQIGIPFKSASEHEHGSLFLYATNGKITDTKYKVCKDTDLKLRFE